MTHQVIKMFYNEDDARPHRVEVVAEDSDPTVAWRMMAAMENTCNDPRLGDLVIFSVREVAA